MTKELDDKLDKLTNKKVTPKGPIVESVHIPTELSADEREAISAEAAAELAEESKIEKRREFKEAEKLRMKKKILFQHGKDDVGEDTELVLITLAPHMPFIKLDNSVYYPNRAYRLNKRTAAVVKEQMFRGDLHDNEIHGKNMRDFYGQRPQHMTLNPNSHNA